MSDMTELTEWFLYLLPLNLAATYVLVTFANYIRPYKPPVEVSIVPPLAPAVTPPVEAPAVPPLLPEPLVEYRMLRLFYHEDENKRFRAAILPKGHVDDINPNGWASIAEMEADLPRTISEMYELQGGGLVAMAHYHQRSRTMLLMMRPKPNDWQQTLGGKLDTEKYLVQVWAPKINKMIAHDSRDPALFPVTDVKLAKKSGRKKMVPTRRKVAPKRKRA